MKHIISILYRYGTIATCFTILIEYACFPISSEIVLPLSGAITKINGVNLVLLILLSVICGIIGSLICYTIGRAIGYKCLDYISKRFPKSKTAFDSCYDFFNHYGNKAVLIARLIPLCRTYISFISGIMKQSVSSFIIYSSIGITIWNTVLISFGYVLGSKWPVIIDIYNNYKSTILILLGIIICIIIYKKKTN